jgi:hypothetical protein
MHVENKEFAIRIDLRASFPDDYEGEEDGYSWAGDFRPLAQALVTAVARTIAAHPGWTFHPSNRGRSSEDEVSFIVEKVVR